MKHYVDEWDNDYYDDHFDLENFDEEYLNINVVKEKHMIGRRRLRNARRSIDEYLELKRLERENHDLFDPDFFDED